MSAIRTRFLEGAGDRSLAWLFLFVDADFLLSTKGGDEAVRVEMLRKGRKVVEEVWSLVPGGSGSLCTMILLPT